MLQNFQRVDKEIRKFGNSVGMPAAYNRAREKPLPRKILIGIFSVLLPVFGQELRLSSPVLSPGKAGTVSIRLVSPAGKEPAALEWELFFPVQQVSIQDSSWSPGGAAKSAGKQLTCVRQLRRQPETYSYKCILAGGHKKIRSGVVAVVKINIPRIAPSGAAVLRLENVLGASPTGAKLEMRPARSTVRIQ